MFEIQFLAPVAVFYRDGSGQGRVVACDRNTPAFGGRLEDFFWGNTHPMEPSVEISPNDPSRWETHPHWRELTLGPASDPLSGEDVLFQLEQSHIDFGFTTSAQPNELWWAHGALSAPEVVTVSRIGRRGIPGGFSGRHLVTPGFLSVYEVGGKHWQVGFMASETLPFRVKSVSHHAVASV